MIKGECVVDGFMYAKKIMKCKNQSLLFVLLLGSIVRIHFSMCLVNFFHLKTESFRFGLIDKST